MEIIGSKTEQRENEGKTWGRGEPMWHKVDKDKWEESLVRWPYDIFHQIITTVMRHCRCVPVRVRFVEHL